MGKGEWFAASVLCFANGGSTTVCPKEGDEQQGPVSNFYFLLGPLCKRRVYCATYSCLIYVASLFAKKKAGTENHKKDRQSTAEAGELSASGFLKTRLVPPPALSAFHGRAVLSASCHIM